MNNQEGFNLDQDHKIELILKYVDGTNSTSELTLVEQLLANDDFSMHFFQSITEVETSLLNLSNTPLTTPSIDRITQKALNEFAVKPKSTSTFKTYGWHAFATSFLILSAVAAYSIQYSNHSALSSVFNSWGDIITTFFLVGMSIVLLLIFDLLLSSKTIRFNIFKAH